MSARERGGATGDGGGFSAAQTRAGGVNGAGSQPGCARRNVERRGSTWPERAAQRRRAAPRGGRPLLPVGHDRTETFVSVFIESD